MQSLPKPYNKEQVTVASDKTQHINSSRLHFFFDMTLCMYKTRMLMDYIHRPVSSTDHDVSETGSLSVLRWM
jgi:hypothetical protein